MCAIVDVNVASEVFSPNPTQAGGAFFNWLNTRRGRLVTGGKQLEELEAASPGFREWASAAIGAGTMTLLNEDRVADRSAEIERETEHKSNDPHVLAIAQLSRARLLFTNDRDLQRDFKAKELIDNPRGRVYHTNTGPEVTAVHQRLLGNRTLCRRQRRQNG